MVICSECGKEIDTVYDYWKRIRDGREVFVCPGCASGMVDERTTNGLILVIGNIEPIKAESVREHRCLI